jgi:hypothetical protein
MADAHQEVRGPALVTSDSLLTYADVRHPWCASLRGFAGDKKDTGAEQPILIF